MLQSLPIVLKQVKAGNTSENLLNEIQQIIFFFSVEKKKLLKKCIANNEINTDIIQKGYYIYELEK